MAELKLLHDISELTDFNLDTEREWIDGYCSVVGDMLVNDKIKEMKLYHHHKEVTCHFHSVFVSYLTYKASVKFNCNVIDATRAALLHDFYLYDWHITKHDELHAWYHPKVAKINAEKYFGDLTLMQKDMILSHMWPLHIVPPKSKEGMILTFADKVCANSDLMGLSEKFEPIYEAINTEAENYELSDDNS